jgi:single-stranded-DNA-specific exonuclease
VQVRSLDDTAVARLAARLRVRAITARCLLGRGVDGDGAAAFLDPRLARLRTPEGDAPMAGFATAADRVTRAVLRGERIAVFGDYDVDGVTTTALLTSFLRDAGAEVVARVARRDEGYGFGAAAADELIASHPGLIITGDCGTAITRPSPARARRHDVVVVDHHRPDRGGHPPWRWSTRTAATRGSRSRHGLGGHRFYSRRGADPAGRQATSRPGGRIARAARSGGARHDAVWCRWPARTASSPPLACAGRTARPRPGRAVASAGVALDRAIDEQVLSWKVSPRLNAPGRLGDTAPAGAPPGCAGAADAAAALETANAARRAAQDVATAEALAAVGDDPGPAIVVASDRWLPGVVGIVAAKLVDRFARPAFVIAVDAATGVGRGSARTSAGVDLYKSLAACAPLLERFGGHAAAAGLTVRADEIDRLREALGAAVLAEGSGRVAASTAADGEVLLGEVDAGMVDELTQLGPFGQDNPEPRLVARRVEVVGSRRVGDGSHLKLDLRCPRTGAQRGAIGFGLGERDPGLGARIDLAFRPTTSTWQGSTRVELEVRDLAIAT